MKKSILILIICLFTTIGFAQDKPIDVAVKQDTIIAIKMNINQFRALIITIDQNIDSKRITSELVEFLKNSAQIVQPADKPKK